MQSEIVIEQITDRQTKSNTARLILESLRDWFELDQAREQYILDSCNQLMVAALQQGQPVGFLCLKETGKDTVELAVMGVLREYQRHGIGRELCEEAKRLAMKEGYSFMQVKTVKMGLYEDYDKTNLFYQSMGFKEFEVFPELWNAQNPCQIYVIALQM